MNIEDLATKQDLEMLQAALLQAMSEYMGSNSTEKPEWLRSKQVRQMLNISDGTLQTLRIKKILNPTKLGSVWYYRFSEIQELLNAGTGQ